MVGQAAVNGQELGVAITRWRDIPIELLAFLDTDGCQVSGQEYLLRVKIDWQIPTPTPADTQPAKSKICRVF